MKKIELLLLILMSIISFSCGTNAADDSPNGNSYGFPSDFPLILDTGGQGSGSYLHGKGGNISKDKAGNQSEILSSNKRVVIFLHGNGGNHQYWTENGAIYGVAYTSFRNLLLNNGYSAANLWAVSFQGQGWVKDTEGTRKNIEDVRKFIDAVIEYTGASKVDIIALSMGCHLARGYILGYKNDGTFDTSLRRITKIGSMILMSGGNYGLGANIADLDWDSNSSLFDTTSANNFSRYDNSTNLTPGSIHYYCIYAKYDLPQYSYNLYGGGHPLNPGNTSRLGSATYFEIPDTYVGTFTYRAYNSSDSDPLNNDQSYITTNHIFQGLDQRIFTDHVLPNLNQ